MEDINDSFEICAKQKGADLTKDNNGKYVSEETGKYSDYFHRGMIAGMLDLLLKSLKNDKHGSNVN